MKRFRLLLVVLFSLVLLAGCGTTQHNTGAGTDQASIPNDTGSAGSAGSAEAGIVGGQGVDRFGSSSASLDDPNWRGDATVSSDYDVNVEPEHRVRFMLNSALISEEASRILAHNAGWIRNRVPSGSINIEGHCDERGTREYNLALGQQRADAVRQFLISQGVDAERLLSVSYGKERPLVWGHDESAWRENRRGEIILP